MFLRLVASLHVYVKEVYFLSHHSLQIFITLCYHLLSIEQTVFLQILFQLKLQPIKFTFAWHSNKETVFIAWYALDYILSCRYSLQIWPPQKCVFDDIFVIVLKLSVYASHSSYLITMLLQYQKMPLYILRKKFKADIINFPLYQ